MKHPILYTILIVRFHKDATLACPLQLHSPSSIPKRWLWHAKNSLMDTKRLKRMGHYNK